MPDLEKLRLRTGQVITEDWYDDLVDILNEITFEGAVDYYGYIRKDLIPIQDLLLNLGIEGKRIKEIHAGYGYFTYSVNTEKVNADWGYFDQNVYVQGKRVIKDEDPIKISEFFDYAYRQIRDAVKDAVIQALEAEHIRAKPERVGIAVNYYAPPLADIFASDLVMNLDGRARFKITADNDVVPYVKLIPANFVDEILAALNAGNVIEKDSWYEFDFTVNKDDKINVKVYPAANVTVIVYNIPEG